jgi:uncharacterized protein YndB with AHSA1/START domain
MTTSYTLRGEIAAPPADVYAALTRQSALEAWLAEHAEVSLTDSIYGFWGRFTPEGERGKQQLIAFEPDSRLSFAWTFQDVRTVVDIELEPSGTGTTVTFTHSSVPERPSDYSAWVRDYWLMSLANLASYAEGREPGPKCDFTAFAPGEVRASVEIDAPASEVFAALTEPRELERWVATRAEVELEVGGRFSFGWDHGPVKILDLEPDKVLAYSWEHTDGPPESVVRWELAGSAGRTRLTIVHSGFGDRPTDGYQLGWLDFLVTLKRMLEVGQSWAPFETVSEGNTSR